MPEIKLNRYGELKVTARKKKEGESVKEKLRKRRN